MDATPTLQKGYAYRFEGKGCWKTAADDDWEIVVVGRRQAEYLGWRRIDGVRVAVYDCNGATYAQKVP